MKQPIDAFGHIVNFSHCSDSSLYTDEEFLFNVNTIFGLDEINTPENRYIVNLLLEGEGSTTEVMPYLSLMHIPGAERINTWVREECAKLYNVPVDKIKISSSWMNRMYRGARGRIHNHAGNEALGPNPTCIAIFYQNNPENGSKLILMRTGKFGDYTHTYPEEDKIYVTPETGDLVIHDPELWHAISEHNSDEPRICFVYHLDLTS